MTSIPIALRQVQAQVASAALQAQRPDHAVRLLAVSKTFPNDAINEAYQAGQRAFGENYVQEGVDKIIAFSSLPDPIEWHLIGPLQSNKTRIVAEHFDWVQSVDRLKIAQRLSEQRPHHLSPLNLCIQVNISNEASKSGVAVSEALDLAQQIYQLPNIRLRGLMAIPQATQDTRVLVEAFEAMAQLFKQLQHHIGQDIDTLSMGMSADMALAIHHGSTMVRVGTAIFGQR